MCPHLMIITELFFVLFCFTDVPKVTITDLAVEGKRTASAVIPCEFKSNPQATQVRWTKFASGTTVQLNIDGNKYQGGTLLSPSLTIYNLDRDDAASYRCEVTNSVGTGVSEYGTLTVDLTCKYLFSLKDQYIESELILVLLLCFYKMSYKKLFKPYFQPCPWRDLFFI